MSEYASNWDSGKQIIYIIGEFWRLFKFVELTGPNRGNALERDPLFIDILIKVPICKVDDNSETMRKSRSGSNKQTDYPKQYLHVFAENAPVSIHNDNMWCVLRFCPICIT